MNEEWGYRGTLGPPSAEQFKGPSGEQLATLSGWRDDLQIERAQLMAAAPDLLAALEKVRWEVHQYAEGFDLLWAEVDAAIEKATGCVQYVPDVAHAPLSKTQFADPETRQRG